MDDTRRIKACLTNDRRAFEGLVRKYQSATYALAIARVRDATAAEEITQDVFVRAYQKLGQLRDSSRFGAWLRSITLRQCGMWLRSNKRQVRTRSLPEEEMGTALSSVKDADQGGEGLFDIAALIEQLPEGLRAAAVLCLEEELSPSAAAAVLGIKPGTLRKRLHDARTKLQFQIVKKAEIQLRLHLLPKDFAQRCVCRCGKAQEAKTRKEVITMSQKKKCGCGCLGRRQSKTVTKTKSKEKK
ncbi:MAG: sigma-70 family RNA polymerase sigma factor [Actinobacteria bacterium]|nr:sigma-70 family RNA polymerase sigma factor [Actinomycetota bacterium]